MNRKNHRINLVKILLIVLTLVIFALHAAVFFGGLYYEALWGTAQAKGIALTRSEACYVILLILFLVATIFAESRQSGLRGVSLVIGWVYTLFLFLNSIGIIRAEDLTMKVPLLLLYAVMTALSLWLNLLCGKAVR